MGAAPPAKHEPAGSRERLIRVPAPRPRMAPSGRLPPVRRPLPDQPAEAAPALRSVRRLRRYRSWPDADQARHGTGGQGMSSGGFVLVHRSLLQHALWTSEPFTRGQAWIDLVLLANHSSGQIRVRGNKMTVRRGQVGWSVKRLADRWQWSRGKVQRFLDELENEQQIEQQKNNITSLITIKNYDHYQSAADTRTNSRRTADGQQTDTNKEERKKGNKKPRPEIPSWVPMELWESFRDHRKALRKPLTPAAEALSLKKLTSLRDKGHDPAAVLTTAIERGWQSLFPPNERQRGNGQQPPAGSTRKLLEVSE